MEEKNILRKFGIVVGLVFLIIALWPLLKGGTYRLWALVPGLVLFVPGLFSPLLLRQPYKLWMVLAHILGWINTRIILGVVFFIVMTPIALVLKLLGKDFLHRRIEGQKASYRETPGPESSLEQQF